MPVSLRESVQQVSDPQNLDASVEEVFRTMLGFECRRDSRPANPTLRLPAGRSVTSSPWKRTRPLPGSGNSRPAMILRSVVFPEPDGPSTATSFPCGTFRSTPSSAV